MPLRVREVASAAQAMPKSITRGPSGASSTLDGLRSRCTTPAPMDGLQGFSHPGDQQESTVPGGIGPWLVTVSCRDGPGT